MKRGVIGAKTRAWAAAATHGFSGRKVRVIVVAGPDGADSVVAFLASILQTAGETVGVIARDYVQIAGKRAEGSDQAHPLDDAGKLHSLLAQMRRAKCRYVIVEQSARMPVHGFAGVPLAMLVVRRCGDDYLSAAGSASRLAKLRALWRHKPKYVVLPRDDSCFEQLQQPGRANNMSYGTHQKAECQLQDVLLRPLASTAKVTIDHQTNLMLETQLPGKQAIYSALAACAAAYLLEVPVKSIVAGIGALSPLPAHFEYLPVQRPYSLVLDCSCTPAGVVETLETLKHFTKNRLIVVVGATLSQPSYWLQTVGEIVAKWGDRVIVTDGDYKMSQQPEALRAKLLEGINSHSGEAKTVELPDRQAAFAKALSIARRGDTVVVCASTTRPYRKLGNERLPWSDKQIFEELLK